MTDTRVRGAALGGACAYPEIHLVISRPGSPGGTALSAPGKVVTQQFREPDVLPGIIAAKGQMNIIAVHGNHVQGRNQGPAHPPAAGLQGPGR